ncbi:hypothetical protein ACT3CE_07785 [Marinifilum sp. RC60d5]|uniref:hypothetical protein n=1 Tax=Marinifilum sp. RC60d5 TaxID=3458414 RepID=UPI0040351572
MLKKLLLAIVFAGFAFSFAQAQEERDLNKEVSVRTTYQPKINKAKRIGELPVVKDTASFTPSFDYFVQTKALSVGFFPAKIPAAKIVGEPLKSLNANSLILAGGNYSTLFGDYRYNNKRSKTTDIGFHLKHYSTNGKLELEDGDKVKPDYTEQLAEVYGAAYLDEGKVSGSLFYERIGYNYYGFPQADDMLGFYEDLFPYDEQKQNKFGLVADFQSAFKDEEKLNFGIGIKYQYFSDDIDLKESDVLISGNAKIRRGDGFWSLKSDFDYFTVDGLYYWEDGEQIKDRKNLIWSLNPQYLLQTGNLNLQLGVKTVLAMGDNSETKLYPDVKIDFEAVDGILSFFTGLKGDLNMNRYKDIVSENYYVFSGLNVTPSNQKYCMFGGLKGSLSKNSSFTLVAEYSAIDNQYFFVKRNSDLGNSNFIRLYSNKFTVLYDDISLLKLSADLNLDWNNQLSLSSSLIYNSYSMDKLEEAWHKPDFEVEVNAYYKFTNELTFQAGVNILGERAVLVDNSKQTLDAVYDLNMSANYHLNENFSVFGTLNNLFADKYYQWDGYPSQGLNFLLGVKANF